MNDHYGISDEEWKNLQSTHGLTITDLFNGLKFFDPIDSKSEISKVNLLYYIDKRGDFQEKRNKFDFLALAVFNTLNIKDKIEVMEYVDWEDEDGDGE